MALSNVLVFITLFFNISICAGDFFNSNFQYQEQSNLILNNYQTLKLTRLNWNELLELLVNFSVLVIHPPYEKQIIESQLYIIEKILEKIVFIMSKNHYTFSELLLTKVNTKNYLKYEEYQAYIKLINRYKFDILHDENKFSYIIYNGNFSYTNNTLQAAYNIFQRYLLNAKSVQKKRKITQINNENIGPDPQALKEETADEALPKKPKKNTTNKSITLALTKKAKPLTKRGAYRIARRYLEEYYLELPYFSHNTLSGNNKGLGKAVYKFLPLTQSLIEDDYLVMREIRSSLYEDEGISVELLYTGAEYSPDTDFLSIVMAGRGLNAFVPHPQMGSFIVLVLSTEQYKNDKKYYDLLLQKGYRLLLIHKIRTGLGELQKDELGLVTSRRIAGFFLAQQLKSPNFIMMDDNLDEIFLSRHLLKKNYADDWLNVVDVFKEAAKSNALSLLSIHSYKPSIDTTPPNAFELHVKKAKAGSKLFYVDWSEFNKDQALKDARWFFPPSVSMWGEDLFMNLAFGQLAKSFGVIDRKAMLLSRQASNTNICLKSLLRLAEGWLEDQSMKEYFAGTNDPALTIIYEAMQKIVENNINQRIQEQEQIIALDLSKKTAEAANKLYEWKKQPHWSLSSALDYKWRPTSLATQLFSSILPSILEENDLNFLFTHQHQALRSLLLSEKNNLAHTGYFKMATGSGKSLIINTLIASMLEILKDEANIALLVPTRDLVHQAYEAIIKFNELNEEGNHLHINLRRVIAVDSNHVRQQYLLLNQKLNAGGYLIIFCNDSFKQQLADTQNTSLINSLQAIMVDELHEAEESLLKSLAALEKEHQTLLYGFSATPGSKAKYFKKQLYKYSRKQGVTDKILAPWQTHIIGQSLFKDVVNNNSTTIPSALDDPKAFADFLRNADIYGDGTSLLTKKGLIFVPPKKKNTNKSYARNLVSSLKEYLTDKNIKIAEVSSEMKFYANKNAIKRFKDTRQNTNILVAIDMLTVGFDAEIDYIVIDRNITNKDKLIQMFGRALRSGRNDKIAHIFLQKDTYRRFKNTVTLSF